MRMRSFKLAMLFQDLRYGSCAHRAAALADGESQSFIHGDRSDQLDFERHVASRHHHFHARRQLRHTGYVGGPEVKLRPVTLKERRVTSALVLAQNVDFAAELLVRLDRPGLGDDLPALDVVLFNTSQ